MSEPIKVGDLVLVVRLGPCGCGKGPPSKTIFTVQAIRMSRSFKCAGCSRKFNDEMIAESGEMLGASYVVYHLWRLKRIPPLSELEGQRTEESNREPA